MALRLGRSPTDRDVLDALEAHDFGLPAECSIDYSLEAVDLLRSLIRERRPGVSDVLHDLCLQLAEEEGDSPVRPPGSACGRQHPRGEATRRRTVSNPRELDPPVPAEAGEMDAAGDFLRELASTSMTRSFKMVVLQAMLHDGRLRAGMPLVDVAV